MSVGQKKISTFAALFVRKMENVNHILNRLIPLAKVLTELEVPYAGEVSAGYPSEATNYEEQTVDFNKMLVRYKETTFCLTAGGDSQIGDGINKGDLLVIDKLKEPYENSILVFSIDGEFTLKRLRYGDGCVELISSNPKFPTIKVSEGEEIRRWGVLTFCIKKF